MLVRPWKGDVQRDLIELVYLIDVIWSVYHELQL